MAYDIGITIRRMRLPYPEDLDAIVVEGQPEESYGMVGLSLLLPYLEPYLIRTMREAKKHVTDPKLLADIDLFNGQEGQHYRQHMLFNEAIHLQGYDELKKLEAEVSADYRRYTETRSLRFNLAYAEGFEAYTSALARFSFESRTTERLHPAVRDLFEWHLIEELEHRMVAFDVYDQVCGGYFYRLAVGLFAQWHLNQFVMRAALSMLRHDREVVREKYGGGFMNGYRRLKPQLWLQARGLLPKILRTYSPWYTPHDIELPPAVQQAAQRFTEMAASGGPVERESVERAGAA